MTESFLPYALPDIGEREIEAVADTMRSGWVTTGPKVKAFEQAFEAYLGEGVECIAVNSATAGLHLALEAIGISPGDEVIVPSLTFTATAEIVRYLGADPVFVDINPESLNIEPRAIAEVVTSRTKAILPVHYGGLACQMDEIRAIAAAHDLHIVQDAAHALPSTFRGRDVGSLECAATVFSFYANKTMTTGEGGMIATRCPKIASRMRVMRLHGIDRDAYDRFRSKKPSWYYEVVAPGFKYNLTDMAAAIGLVQLERLPEFTIRRNALAERYFELLADLPLILPRRPDQGDAHAWHLFVIRLDDDAVARGLNRDNVIEQLSAMGIGTSVHYVPLHRQPYWRDTYNLSPDSFPHADRAYQTMISIPLYTKMCDADQDRVVDALRTILR